MEPEGIQQRPSISRRQFLLSLTAFGGALSVRSSSMVRSPWSLVRGPASVCSCAAGPTANGSFPGDLDNWQRHGMAHLINVFWPGDDGCLAFDGDSSPLESRLPQQAPDVDPPDTSPSAYSACVINALFDPYYTYDQQHANFAMVGSLDWHTRLGSCTPHHDPNFYFHEADWTEQIRSTNAAPHGPLGLIAPAWSGAWLLTMAIALGAANSYIVTNDIGWPGPSNHYYHGTPEGSYVNDRWLRPEQDSGNGNLQ